ncbi:MAG TPA: hypothetical protein VKB80_20225 [Kofleriaceae bacterium]|nr:hypothetical protein [Kofleriaceae bacterium]
MTAVLLATPAYAQTPSPPLPPATEPPHSEQRTAQAAAQQPPTPEAPPAATPPPAEAKPPAPEPKPVTTKGDITLYGIVDFTAFYDSVQNFGGEGAGNTAIPRDGSYAAEHHRLQFSPRGSRFGMKLAAPEFDGIKMTGQIEADFVGNAFAPGGETGFYTNPTLRIRHAWGKISAGGVDLTIGQTWQLFGWVPSAVSYSVMVAGLPGQVYSRNGQIRVSKVVKGDAMNIEFAGAAVRPVERDSATPDGQAGVRVLLNKFQTARTPGPSPGVVEPASIGVSGIVRRFEVPAFEAGTTDSLTTTGFGVAADILFPIIPAASKEHRASALTLTAEAVYGEGIADLYTAFTGGIALPTALPDPDPTDGMPAPAYAAGVDNGLVSLTPDGTDLEAIKWTTLTGGLQYFATESVFLAANGSYLKSSNIGDLAPAGSTAVYDKAFFFDGMIGWDIVPATARVGLEFASFHQTYVDDEDASSYRIQLGSWYQF